MNQNALLVQFLNADTNIIYETWKTKVLPQNFWQETASKLYRSFTKRQSNFLPRIKRKYNAIYLKPHNFNISAAVIQNPDVEEQFRAQISLFY